MEHVLQTVPADSIALHGSRHDFSVWLKARSMFDLASRIRPRSLSEFEDVEHVRRYLLEVLRDARNEEQRGVITDFSPRPTGPENRFTRIGHGSIGGKGRGVAFVGALTAATWT
jgi:hypothetical protein